MLIKGSRKKRIAEGAGVNMQQVNQLLKQFEKMKKMKGKKMQNMLQKIQGSDLMNKLPTGMKPPF